MKTICFEIDDRVANELSYIVELHRAHGAPYRCDSTESIARIMLSLVAFGSKQPRSWERLVLDEIGLIAYGTEHQKEREV